VLDKLLSKIMEKLFGYGLYDEEDYENDIVESDDEDTGTIDSGLKATPKGLLEMLKELTAPYDIDDDETVPVINTPNRTPHLFRAGIDVTLLLITIVTMLFGLIVLFGLTATENNIMESPFYYLQRQGMFALMGFALMTIFCFIDYRILKKIAVAFYVMAITMAILVRTFGEYDYASRYIILGGFSFRVTDILCFSMIFLVATFVGSEKKFTLSRFFITVIIVAVVTGASLLANDFSAAFGIYFIALIICLIKKPGAAIVFTILPIILMFFTFSSSHIISSRLSAWLDPFNDPMGSGWQSIQSIYNIAAGGVLGMGLGEGSAYQMKYMPDVQSGYILSGISYQLGLIGSVLILVLLSLLVIRIIFIAVNSSDGFAFYFAAGVAAKMTISIIFSALTVVNAIPASSFGGLPFVSYGGTSLLFDFICIGIILNISRYSSGVKSPSLMRRGR